MIMPQRLNFKISSALKDIIGRDLITDDIIAIFELVKNSFDAYATRVDISFENLHSGHSQIIIKDNGKGMNYDDLINKWLFVAYSAKKEGTEDSNFDYRDSIYKNRPFAGAKGIGRFSCDRLGKQLVLETVKKENNPKVHVLVTNWENFENNLKDEFINIKVNYSSKKTSQYNLDHGTVLRITGLRSQWDRDKLKYLKDSLGKLVNPHKDKGQKQFEIFLHVPEEIPFDKKEKDVRDKINGIINNFIFEDLKLKTTRIFSSISIDGKYLITELRDGNTLIYKIKEKNNFSLLKHIDFTLFYLNRSAKITFAHRMGLASRLYGHVFLYKNGFRIYPFGEPNEDPLKIDERKSRKQYSRLGTSEIIGQIELFGNNPELKETSSRSGGLIITDTYLQLKKCFNLVLERLEKYVVEVQEWGLSIEGNLDEYDDKKIKAHIIYLIKELTDSNDILSFSYGNNFLQIIRDAQEESLTAILSNINKIARKSGNHDLIAESKKVEKLLTSLRHAKDEAEKEINAVKHELIEKESQNLFLRAVKSQDFEDIVNFMHFIAISTSTIQNFIKGVVFRADNDIEITNNDLKSILATINVEVGKIYSISRIATKANFKLGSKPTKLDIKEFIREYLTNVVIPFLPVGIKLSVYTDDINPFTMEVQPLEITMLIDNLISNSKKAKAKNIIVKLESVNQYTLVMSIKDDGIGIKSEIQDSIYNYGFTTSDGSGLGLTHVWEILKKLGSTIELNTDSKNGAEFIINFNRFVK
jgi:signal transduction histidine kinase